VKAITQLQLAILILLKVDINQMTILTQSAT